MKRIFLLATVLALGNAAFSQINKGQWLVGGTASFDSRKITTSTTNGTTSIFTLMPNAGYFFADKLAGGVRVDLESQKEEDADAYSTFVFSPFLRYYFLPTTSKTNIFADASYGIGSTGEGDKEGINQYAIKAGPAFFLTPNVALEVAAKYYNQGGDYYDRTFGNNSRMSVFGVEAGFQIHLGGSK